MAVVIPVEKLVKGLSMVTAGSPIYIRLRNTNTTYRDKVTGWTIAGNEIKELPTVSPGHPLSQSMFAAIRSGRFVRVIVKGTKVKRKKYEELVDSIIKEYDSLLSIEEKPDETDNI